MLTVKQHVLIRNLLSGKFATNKDAAIASGYSTKGAAQSVSRLVHLEEFRAALEVARTAQLEREAKQLDKETEAGGSAEALRRQKLALEVQLQEAKLLALQPDTALEDADAVRESWTRTITYVYKEAVRICTASSADAALALVPKLRDLIETRSTLGVFDNDAPAALRDWPLDSELTNDAAKRIQAEHAQAERATSTAKHPYKPRNARQLAEASAHHETE